MEEVFFILFFFPPHSACRFLDTFLDCFGGLFYFIFSPLVAVSFVNIVTKVNTGSKCEHVTDSDSCVWGY
jgi:Na+/H+-dicarboxylate symporter